jgi:glycine C-acetyltransferase
VIAGDETKAVELSQGLWDEGVFTPAVVFPTVGRGKARVRTIVTADHTEDDLGDALAAFERVGKKLELL